VEHLLDSARVVASLDDLQGDTLVNSHAVHSPVHDPELELTLELVNAEVVHLLKLLVYLFLHFLVFQKWDERVTILTRVLLLTLLLFLVLHKRYK
jgi:hypothetical protein